MCEAEPCIFAPTLGRPVHLRIYRVTQYTGSTGRPPIYYTGEMRVSLSRTCIDDCPVVTFRPSKRLY